MTNECPAIIRTDKNAERTRTLVSTDSCLDNRMTAEVEDAQTRFNNKAKHAGVCVHK